jgi:hypothetical protein
MKKNEGKSAELKEEKMRMICPEQQQIESIEKNQLIMKCESLKFEHNP